MPEYSKVYFFRYLSASEETRKESKKHWFSVFMDEEENGKEHSLSAAILAMIAIADGIIRGEVV